MATCAQQVIPSKKTTGIYDWFHNTLGRFTGSFVNICLSVRRGVLGPEAETAEAWASLKLRKMVHIAMHYMLEGARRSNTGRKKEKEGAANI